MLISEKEELEQLKSDSMQSFEKLYFRYSAKLYNFVLKLSKGDTFMAEELVQRTFIKVWENRSQINPEKAFMSYVFTIAKNMLLNEYQHQTIEFIYREYIKEHFAATIDNIELEVNKNLLDEYIEKLTEKLP
jgi:RNA polymerase sigma-70 factor (ECF subfamily)